jgi:hypothetical protein
MSAISKHTPAWDGTTLRQLQMQWLGRKRHHTQSLRIGVCTNEFHTSHTALYHVLYSVTTAPTHTNHTDLGVRTKFVFFNHFYVHFFLRFCVVCLTVQFNQCVSSFH